MVNLPELGPKVPRQGGWLTAALGRLLLRLTGWGAEGRFPDVDRAVMIAAPHTSNWDFPVGLMVKFAMCLRVDWLGKHTIFRFPFGLLWRRLGGIPVDRGAPRGVVGEVLREFQRRDKLLLGVAPEGTRKKVAEWKSGFYRIAQTAGVPILPVAIDYSRRRLVFLPLFHPTGDYDADLPKIRAHFTPEMAYRPENF